MAYYMYILRCSDQHLFAGITTNVEESLLLHQKGSASAFTKKRRPVHLLYVEEFPDLESTVNRCEELKHLGYDALLEKVADAAKHSVT